MENILLSSRSTDLMLITSKKKNAFVATSGLVFDQTMEHHSLTKLTGKINHQFTL